ncbi:MAG: hypothetical protein HY814_09480 [Candidatus Riflebacteria bacterium]|nr:hypothetical protein [Candidatus Riflebacteria bacterium]
MEIFFEVKDLFGENANRTVTGGRFEEAFQVQIEKGLWCNQRPALQMGDPGDATDYFGSLQAGEVLSDVAQFLEAMLAVSRLFPRCELHVKAEDCPGFVLEGKIEIAADGKFQRYGRQLAAYIRDHALQTVPWEFLIDPRIWLSVVGRHPDASENQILTLRLGRGLALVHNSKLKDPFLGFPLDYPGLDRRKKELKVPTELAAKVMAMCESLHISRQELTERSVYAGLLK